MKDQQQPTIETSKDYIYSIDFSNIIHKMVKHQGWLRKDAVRLSQAYRNFLYLNRKYADSEPLPPSEEIDEFWHNHILDTKQYRQDCHAIFGDYLDHYPYFGIDESSDFSDLEDAFSSMLSLYQQEFGEPLSQIRTWYSSLAHFIKKQFLVKPKRVKTPV